MLEAVFAEGFIASLIAGMITGIGGFCIFFKKRYLKAEINQFLNLAAGVMLAASFFSLLVPAMKDIVGKGGDIHVEAFSYFCFRDEVLNYLLLFSISLRVK